MTLSVKNMSVQDKLAQLRALYAEIPQTTCTKTTCADWCCSKLDTSKDEAGNFMSLPLIYTIEYYCITEYIIEHFSDDQLHRIFDYRQKCKKCVFREKSGCSIYPVRPFSCRVYGRSVPDIFWGIEYPEGTAKAIFCPHCKPADQAKEALFRQKYASYWDQLRILSSGLHSIPEESRDIFKLVTGMDELLILGWQERNQLLTNDRKWYELKFTRWWETYSNLL